MSLAIQYRPIDSLTPYANNARTHSAEQIEQIAGSIKEFGFTNPILIDGANGVIAGHGRIAAARALGMDSLPCVELAGLSEAQKRAYILADNKLALNADWDAELLALELDDLRDMGFDLPLIGFVPGELNDLIGTPNTGYDPDEVLPVPVVPVSRAGDLWRLGKHRLLCGDSTQADDVVRVMGGAAPLLMVTDPPYGVDYDPNWRNEAADKGLIDHAARRVGIVTNDDRIDWSPAWNLAPCEVAYCWHAGWHASEVQRSLEMAEFEIRCQLIWAKPRFAISRGHYNWQHEPCWYAVRKGATAHWIGDHSQATLWEVSLDKNVAGGHSTQKPVELMARAIRNHDAPQVYDPFVGSGTTIIAAEMTARACYALDIAPQYVDVAILRWQLFTGLEAVHADNSKTFTEIKNERC